MSRALSTGVGTRTYATGGNGGAALPGTESDRLASQGSLVYDAGHSLLLAVKPGGESEVEMALATMGTRVTKIGKFLRERRVLVHKDGREERIKTAATDEIWRLEARLGSSSD